MHGLASFLRMGHGDLDRMDDQLPNLTSFGFPRVLINIVVGPFVLMVRSSAEVFDKPF